MLLLLSVYHSKRIVVVWIFSATFYCLLFRKWLVRLTWAWFVINWGKKTFVSLKMPFYIYATNSSISSFCHFTSSVLSPSWLFSFSFSLILSILFTVRQLSHFLHSHILPVFFSFIKVSLPFSSPLLFPQIPWRNYQGRSEVKHYRLNFAFNVLLS